MENNNDLVLGHTNNHIILSLEYSLFVHGIKTWLTKCKKIWDVAESKNVIDLGKQRIIMKQECNTTKVVCLLQLILWWCIIWNWKIFRYIIMRRKLFWTRKISFRYKLTLYCHNWTYLKHINILNKDWCNKDSVLRMKTKHI